MLIKKADSRAKDLKILQNFLRYYRLTPQQRKLIEKEIRILKLGWLGEKESAYYIDFYYKDSKNWVVIHDLRLEFGGNVAQIDHILINRLFEIYVLESKNFKASKIKISEKGEFSVKYGRKWIGIPSPIEQNERHINLLSKVIKAKDLPPKRLGMSFKPYFWNYVLVSPKTIIERPKSKFENVIKADMLTKTIEENAEKLKLSDFAKMFNLCTLDTIIEFAKKLVALHKPKQIDWAKKFKISPAQKKHFCQRCKKEISEKEAKYCLKNRHLFLGNVFCFSCQKLARRHLSPSRTAQGIV